MALLEHPTSAQAAGGYSLSSFLTNPANSSATSGALASMVGDLLEQHQHDSGSIQVTGKVALQNSSSSTTASTTSTSAATSVIRRSPDSPDSGNEDSSAWFLRQVLQQQQQKRTAGDEEDSPLTPATSPARGLRRPRHSSTSSSASSSEEEAELEELKKEEGSSAEDADQERNKRARVETIISTMRTSTPAVAASNLQQSTSSTAPTSGSGSINGCKKRKLYQPQQHGKFTSEGEEEEDQADETIDERNDSLVSEEQLQQQINRVQQGSTSRSSSSAAVIMSQQHDPIRSLQERIASLHQQRFAALQQQQHHQKPAEQQHQVRRPVRDDAGRTRNPLQQSQQHFGMRSALSSDLSHVSQAHAAYLDATRRLLMEQQQRQQRPAQQPVIQPVQPMQQTKEHHSAATTELEGLAEMLKSELANSLAQLVDSTLSRFAAQQQRKAGNSGVIVNNSKLADQESELSKLQRGRVIDRGLRNGDLAALGLTSPFLRTPYGPAAASALVQPQLFAQQQQTQQPSPNSAMSVHSAIASFAGQQSSAQQEEEEEGTETTEQNEALSLVVSPKKRRLNHNNNNKDESSCSSPARRTPDQQQQTRLVSPLEISLVNHSSSAQSPPPSRTPTPPTQRSAPQQQHLPSAGPPPPLLHHPNLFTNYSAYFAAAAAAAAHQHQQQQQRSKSPSAELDLTSPSTSSLLHPALLASHHHHSRHHHHSHHDSNNIDRHSESSDGASPYGSGSGIHQSSTLTPMHLRKAKLMFFWCRYPSSSVLKTFFPDVNFNKNNTAQLVKWFSNFREFYYIQMEKYSRQLLSEGVVNADDIHVSADSELFRALNLHYNRNNHIEVPAPFVYVVSETLREFFKAIQAGKDAEPSWKKAIYKIIARLDEPVPEYFRTPNFLEHLE